MHAQMETNVSQLTRTRRSRKPILLIFAIFWMLLLGGGVYGGHVYIEKTKADLTAAIEQQTAAQIAALQADYEAQLTAIDADFNAQMAEVGSKVDGLNELLTFTKDNATDETDNSNKLYTEIAEVKKKLDALQKSLDVLQ